MANVIRSVDADGVSDDLCARLEAMNLRYMCSLYNSAGTRLSLQGNEGKATSGIPLKTQVADGWGQMWSRTITVEDIRGQLAPDGVLVFVLDVIATRAIPVPSTSGKSVA
jgi:hypothetical protein